MGRVVRAADLALDMAGAALAKAFAAQSLEVKQLATA
jgi:hypothetical protein